MTTDLIDPTLDQAIAYLTTFSAQPPESKAVVEALLTAEKTAKQTKVRHSYSELLGTWRLGFITGTKRSRQRAGVVLGAGRFLPKWVKIQLSYSPSEASQEQGTVVNSVELGSLQLVVTGPTQFFAKTNILAFDFTRINLSLFGLKLYNGYIRGGQEREASFYDKPLKDKAFFTYFLVENQAIAARGRGGGLALWTAL
ncbi:hypothetical protein MC7420_7696 [Coleofasciculus chthonoplastes PCC 7420]|uniref:Plastid lipid-associated protein/fibrillin conserved domain-containing protein n=1 Tax=Coleofasciculus chthonoplastes PCC 7420 TaxID=118168 RepID=B4VIP6_9CYAN|nr:hypothetical protein [Coleofasciculus chthonoplastes]EDX77958.1 hypothetical protein MC7420_7696 [Coleofasciculus chthonoplastes PCC 7420]